ncbi:MAG: MaoC/PaaZ C-terminal domain-containing protein [Myxococcota bacterium]|nr:MaoC/PaaZ C-terminal domain-containing protein [Myxococcota bacterium]
MKPVTSPLAGAPPTPQREAEHHALLPSTGRLMLGALKRRQPLRAQPTLPPLAISTRLEQPSSEWLRAYREICGLSQEGGWTLCAPQVFAVRPQLALLTDPRCPLPALGMVHCESLICAERPVPSEGTLTIRCHIDPEASWGERGLRFSLWSELFEGEQRCWWSKTQILSPRAGRPGARQGPRKATQKPSGGLDQIENFRLAADLGRRYGKIAGDRNPIHLWPWSARLFGFKRPIIHGMWSLARAYTALGGGDLTPGERLWARFQRPVMLPGALELYAASATHQDEEVGQARNFELWLPNAEGRRAVEGSWSRTSLSPL